MTFHQQFYSNVELVYHVFMFSAKLVILTLQYYPVTKAHEISSQKMSGYSKIQS